MARAKFPRRSSMFFKSGKRRLLDAPAATIFWTGLVSTSFTYLCNCLNNNLQYHDLRGLTMGKGQRICYVTCFSMLTGCRDRQALRMLPLNYAPTLANNHRSRTPSGHRVTNFRLQRALEYALVTMYMPLSDDCHTITAP